MRDLDTTETNSVAAGAVPILLATLGFVWYEADDIQTAMEGFFDGFAEATND